MPVKVNVMIARTVGHTLMLALHPLIERRCSLVLLPACELFLGKGYTTYMNVKGVRAYRVNESSLDSGTTFLISRDIQCYNITATWIESPLAFSFRHTSNRPHSHPHFRTPSPTPSHLFHLLSLDPILCNNRIEAAILL